MVFGPLPRVAPINLLSVRHEYDELSLNTTNENYHEFEYSGP